MLSNSIILSLFLTLNSYAKALESNDLLDVSYPYVASNREIADVMTEFAQRTQVPVSLSDALAGPVDVRNSDGTIGSFLDQIAASSRAVWWHDGIVLHVEPATSISSAYIDVEGAEVDDLQQQIEDVGLDWGAFPIRFSKDGSIARIAGPESYVKQVSEVLERLVAIRRNRPERVRRSVQPRLYLGGRSVPVRADDTAPRDAQN